MNSAPFFRVAILCLLAIYPYASEAQRDPSKLNSTDSRVSIGTPETADSCPINIELRRGPVIRSAEASVDGVWQSLDFTIFNRGPRAVSSMVAIIHNSNGTAVPRFAIAPERYRASREGGRMIPFFGVQTIQAGVDIKLSVPEKVIEPFRDLELEEIEFADGSHWASQSMKICHFEVTGTVLTFDEQERFNQQIVLASPRRP